MQNIIFDNGLKSYAINGDENCVIRFNPSDFGILKRIEEMKTEIEKMSGDDETIETADKAMREKIDTLFNANICDAAFGGANCLSMSGGQPICVNFLEAIIPIIKKEAAAEAEKSKKKIAKYTKQVKK